jgi:ribulose-bisphosphate carboxylase large chain
MKGTPNDDITAANGILKLVAQGHFFEQSWSKIPSKDKDVLKMVREDSHHHVILQDDSWRGIKKCAPIVSGGLNPVLLKSFIDIAGTTDFITTMGAGCHAHPDGTQAGAAALVQAMEAYQKKKPIEKYAKKHPELARAIEFFGKKKKDVKTAEEVEKTAN